MQRTLRVTVFFPPFVLLLAGTLISIFYKQSFLTTAGSLHQSLLKHLGSTYSITAFLMVIACLILFVSPIGKLRIGGEQAKPDLTRWQWFTISLCSTVACGLLFWGTAEPLFHYFQPPNPALAANSHFALASLMLH